MKKRILFYILFIVFSDFFPYQVIAQDDHGFRFIRLAYGDYDPRMITDYSMRGRGGGYTGRMAWMHDYPTSEDNLYEAIARTTKIQLAGQYMIIPLRDERIFNYPFLYMSEPGYWLATDQEIKNLREYFKRGGFVMFDDFRSAREWSQLYYNLKLIFPDKEPVLVPNDHPIWSIYYKIDPVEAPSWVTPRYSKYEDQYWTILDDKGRMTCIICYNQDVGDGWEWPQMRLDKAETLPFQMGINFIMYALTH
jgi:hypothetical protein